jgi:PKD repeat protein
MIKNYFKKYLAIFLGVLMILATASSFALADIEVLANNDFYMCENDVTINAQISNIPDLDRVVLHYEIDGAQPQRLTMNNDEGDLYSKKISSVTVDPEDGMVITYFITVEDVNENILEESNEFEYTYDCEAPDADFLCVPLNEEGEVIDLEGEDIIINENSAILCDAFTEEGDLTYEWTFGDEGTSDLEQPDYIYTEDGTYDVSLTLTDLAGNSATETKEEYITVLPPPLEILQDSVAVYVDDVALENLNVAPGDLVTVTFNYKNNLDGLVIGHLNIAANSEPLDFIDHAIEDWALLPQSPTQHQFEFTVPQDLTENFNVLITLMDEDANGVEYEAFYSLSFNLVRLLQNVHVNEITIEDSSLTCTKTTDLTVDLINNGANPTNPELWLFDGPAEMDNEGNFDREPEFGVVELFDDENRLQPGESDEIEIEADFNDLPEGENTVYAYVVSPFFWDAQDGFFLAGNKEIPITVGECLNWRAIEEALTIPKNSQEPKSVDLFEKEDENYLYINEDFDYENTLNFAIAFSEDGEELQSNSDIVSCSLNEHTIECEEPSLNKDGASEISLDITEGNSEIQESFVVTVGQALEIEDVVVSQTGKPGEEFQVQFRVKNYVGQQLISVNVGLTGSEDFAFAAEPFHVNSGNPGDSGLKTISGIIPAGAEGEYNLVLTATSRRGFTDTYEFNFEVVRENTKILIAVGAVNEENSELTCNSNYGLTFTLTNTGEGDENDLVVVIKEGNEIVWNSVQELGQFISLARGETSAPFVANVPILGEGTHSLSAELLYNFAGAALETRGVAASSERINNFDSVRKNNCLNSLLVNDVEQEESDEWLIMVNTEIQFEVTVDEDDQENFNENLIAWFLNNEDTGERGRTFLFSSNQIRDHTVLAVYNGDQDDSFEALVTVTDRPLCANCNIPLVGEINLESFEGLVFENEFVKVRFLEAVDLSNILDLNTPLVTLGNSFVSINTELAPELDVPAEVTVKNFPQGRTVIYSFAQAGNPAELAERKLCSAETQPTCRPVSHIGGAFVFRVEGFSTYQVVNEQNIALSTPTSLEFSEAARGETANITFQVTNTGTIDSMSMITFQLSGFAEKYSASLANTPLQLRPGESATVTLNIEIPNNENAGRHKIGSVIVDSAETEAKTVPVFVTPKTFLKIENVKVKDNEIKLDDITKIEVKVRNEYTEDMDEVIVTVTILDVDGDDIEEESNEFDINDGDSEKVTIEFDFQGEKLDEDEYTIEVKVEGVADDDSEHEDETTKTTKVNRKRHQVVITRADLTASTLQCLRQTNLRVEIENVGKSDEDDVEIRVTNSALNLNQERTNIDVEKYSDSDNDFQATFSINAEGADSGVYPINVEVLRDGKVDAREDVQLSVQDCELGKKTTTVKNDVQASQANELLAQQLQQQLNARKNVEENVVTSTSFRNSDTYTMLLGILVVLVFIALVLALAIVALKRR